MHSTPVKILFFILGSFSLGLAVLGIVLPGLPTTPFLLLSAALYVKSSSRIYNWLIHHKVFGKMIREYRENKTIPRKSKILALSMMAVMISFSVFFVLKNIYLQIAVFILGSIGAAVVYSIPTSRKEESRFLLTDTEEKKIHNP